MLGKTAGHRLERYVPDYVIFDLETTGISPQSDAVIEVSAIRVRSGRVSEEFSSLVNPERFIPWGATRVNGITDAMVADAPKTADALWEFLQFAGEDPLIGHNIQSFDLKFLERDCLQLYGAVPANDYLDTLLLARRTLPGLKHHRLVDLAEHYGCSTEGAHRALADCRMNQLVYERLARETVQTGRGPAGERLRLCPLCGQRLWKRRGRYGEFWGCGGYPSCRYTEKA